MISLIRNVAFIALAVLLTLLPAGPTRITPAPAAPAPPPPASFSSTLGDAYARFDDQSETWVLGNAAIEERLELTPEGNLQEISLADRAKNQLWPLSDSVARLELAAGAGKGGKPIDLTTGLKLASTSALTSTEGALELHIQMDQPSSGEELTVELQIRPGYPVIERRASVANPSPQPVRVTRADSLALRLAATAPAVWEATYFSTTGNVRTQALGPGQRVVTEVPLVSGSPEDFVPYLVLRDTASGQGFFSGLRWSSNWHLSINLDATGNPRFRGGLHLDDSLEDSLLLMPGESLEGPWSLVGLFNGDTDDATQVIHSYISASSPPRPSWATLPPITWNSWFAYLHDVTDQRLQAEADLASQLGVEVFYVDYGWSQDLGDWKPDLVRFPQGLGPLAQEVHAKGMQFGLWVAFGDASPDSVVAREHPEFLAVPPEPAATGIDGGLVYCLSQAQDWVTNELDRIVTDYHVDWIKFDQPMIAACQSTGHDHEPNTAGSLLANNLAFYRALDKLRTAHPDLIIEDCFNGDGYLDYGTRQYTSVSWLTDDSGQSWTAMPKVQQDFYDVSYAFRPDYLVQWLAAVTGTPAAPGRTTSVRDLAYQAYSSMVGSWGLSLRLTEMDQDQLSLLRRLIGEYKTVRPLIAKGNFYHLVGPSDLENPFGGGWFAVEYYDPQEGQGAILDVRNGEDSPQNLTVRLRGLDPGATYRVAKLGEEAPARQYTGADLLSSGLPLAAEPRQGNWILLRQVK